MELKEYILEEYYNGNNIFPLKVIINGKRSGVNRFNGKHGELINVEKRNLGWKPFYIIKIGDTTTRVYEKEFELIKEEKDRLMPLIEEKCSHYPKTASELLVESYNEFSTKIEKMTKDELLKSKQLLEEQYNNCDECVKALFLQPISMVNLVLRLKFECI